MQDARTEWRKTKSSSFRQSGYPEELKRRMSHRQDQQHYQDIRRQVIEQFERKQQKQEENGVQALVECLMTLTAILTNVNLGLNPKQQQQQYKYQMTPKPRPPHRFSGARPEPKPGHCFFCGQPGSIRPQAGHKCRVNLGEARQRAQENG
ncbi:hypothetical protein BOX15_Mlig008906g1 [Macrostomum lignano]|uniref:Uncharacterized protein n=1 Tax=Macrostomum lignano TaxID=282301 RepID=A0A267GML4_9PLAT|nr:hypothetical protein BOX15_Mlig008906g1 [Macrostomum lignano]